jgi:Bacterial Ig domain/Putative Ig domain/Collagen triple helix repeat (20 copies)
VAIFYSTYTYALDASKNITTTPYTAAPAGTDFNYQDGDLFVLITATSGTPYKAGANGSRLGWTSYSSNPKPYGSGGSPAYPVMVPTSASAAITVAVNQVLTNQPTVSAYGGSAVQVNTGTTISNRGVSPVYNVTFSPALPAWVTPTYVKSVATINVGGVDNLYNKVEVQLNGTAPATAITEQVYTVTFTDAAGASKAVQATFTLKPAAAAPPTNPPVASNVSQTVPYNSTNNTITLSATNSPTSVAVATAPSHGTATAVGTTITYTPTSGYSGSDTFTYTATNAGGTSTPATVTITIPAPVILGVTSAVVGTKTFTVSTAITAFNPVTISSAGVTPYTYSIVSPTLPNGLAISTATGIISGTPTAPASLANYTVQVADSSSPIQTSSTQFAMVVNPNIPVAVVSGSISILTQGVGYTPFTPVTVQGGTGTAPFSFAIGASTPLPSGLVYSSAGVISGTATAFTNVLTPYTVNITDAVNQNINVQFYLRVNALPALSAIVNPTYANIVINTGTAFSAIPVSASPSASGYGILSYEINPSLSINGLTFSTGAGSISGTPIQVSPNTQYSITISDQASQKSTGTFYLQTVPPPPTPITIVKNLNSVALVAGATTNLPSKPIGAINGLGTYTYSISPGLPSGLTFVTTSGYITGVATTSTPNGQAVVYSVVVTDQYPQSNTGTFNLTVTLPTAINLSTPIPSVSLVQNTAVSTTYPNGLIPVSAIGGYQQLSYSISPSIPAGLIFNSNTGAITGSPSNYWTTSTAYSVTVRDQASQVSTGTFNLVITPPAFTVTTNPAYASQTFTQSIPISIFQPVSATGGAQPYTSYEINDVNLGGLTFSTSTGQISGTPSQVLSTTTYSVTITDTVGTRGTSSFSVYIAAPNPLSAITSATYASNTLTVGSSVGLPIRPILLLSNGYGSLTYSINPPLTVSGISFTTSTGVINGIPLATLSTTTYTINVHDSLPTPQTTSNQFSLYIKYADLVTTLTTSSITLVNTVYTSTQQLITFTGGAQQGVTYSVSPQIPSYPALQFVSPGIVQGTPGTTSTTSSYALTVTDNVTGLSSSKNININIVDPPSLSYLATGTVALTVNVATSGVFPVRAVGGYGALTYILAGATNGTLAIKSATGELTGTPSTLSLATPYSVTIRDSANQVVTGTFSISVISTPILIVQNSLSVPLVVGATTNLPSKPIGATGGTPPYTYSVGPAALPSGLNFVSTSGYITGVATTGTNGPVAYSVTVSDPYQSNTGSFNLNVTYPLPITLTTITNVALVQGTAASTTYSTGLIPINALGTGYQTLTYAVNTALPAGLSFNTSNGAITGTPSVYYSTSTAYNVTVRDQASQINTGTFNLVISPPAFSVRTDAAYANPSLINTVPITSFQPIVATGGATPYSYQISDTNLGGLVFSTSTGVISGTPNQLLSNSYTVTVTDLLGSTGTSSFNLSIVAARALAISTAPQYVANTLTVGTATNFTPVVVGSAGYGNLTFSIQPSLPSNLIFTNGTISGTPQVVSSTGTYTVTVTDSLPVKQTSSTQFTVSVEYTPFTTSITTSTVKLTKGVQSSVKVINYAGGGGGGVSYSTVPVLPEYPNIQLVSPGVISGTPSSTSTTATYALVVTDNVTGQTSTQYISLYIAEPSSLVLQATGTTVVLYANSATTGIKPVTATGGIGSLSYSISGGSLPNGTLNIGQSNGVLNGIPVNVSSTASYSVTVTDTQSNKSTATFSLTVLPPPITLTVNSPSKVIPEYSQVTTFQPVGGTNLNYGGLSYSISPTIDALGLVYNTGTGFISGTPIAYINSTPYAVTISDQNGQKSTGTFNLTITPSTPPSLTAFVPQSLQVVVVGDTVNLQPVIGQGGFLISGNDYTYSISPVLNFNGISYNTSTGYITGTALSSSTAVSFSVTVKDSVPQTATSLFQIRIDPAPPVTAAKGYAGSIGYAGSRGYAGSVGPQGPGGYAGSIGYTGSVGPTGPQGPGGYAGSVGAQGPQGYAGSVGPTGPQGPGGYAGSVGAQGPQGYAGSVGPTGPQGPGGYDGSVGAQGPQGYAGSVGPTGPQGPGGYDGSRGFAGYDGSVGYTGSKGDPGTSVVIVGTVSTSTLLPPSGNANGDGYIVSFDGHLWVWTTSIWTDVGTIKGPAGADGYWGSRGYIGYFGSTGYDGSRGFTGYDGSRGYTGYDGSRGFTGYDGSRGFTGYFGSTGYDGSRGYTGYDGSRGYTGYDGSRGYTGYNGSKGYTGSIGAIGPTGPQGPAGYVGSTGYTGSQGTGLQISGYVGSSGGLPNPYCGSIGTIYTTGNNSHLWIWTGFMWVDLGAIGYTGSYSGGGGMGGSPNLDGGEPWTNYGGIASICGGGVSV